MQHHFLLEEIGRMPLPELIKLKHHLEQQIRSKAIEAGPRAFLDALQEAKSGQRPEPGD
jgi:hypothetical protein